MYNGKMNKIGPKVNDMKLFASKSSGVLEKDRTPIRLLLMAAHLNISILSP